MTQEELLNQPGLQAVLVETRVRDSLQAAAACIDAGCHVHLDKPAGESLPDFEKLLQAAESKKLLVQLGYMYRYNPGFSLLHGLLREGWLGDVFEIQAVMSKVVGVADRQQLAEYPGGMLFELGCHLLDQVIRVLGAPQRVHGYARHSGEYNDSLKDNMLAVLEYPKALATVKSTAIEIDGGNRRHFTVCGTAGTLHIQPLDLASAMLTLDAPRGTWKSGTQTIALPAYTRYVDDAADMAKIIRGEKPSDYSFQHDLTVQRTLLRACGLL
jgi:predicted dehydrogenase